MDNYYKATAIFEYNAWDSFVTERPEIWMHSHILTKEDSTPSRALSELIRDIESMQGSVSHIGIHEDNRLECEANYDRNIDESPLEHEFERYYITITMEKVTLVDFKEKDIEILTKNKEGK